MTRSGLMNCNTSNLPTWYKIHGFQRRANVLLTEFYEHTWKLNSHEVTFISWVISTPSYIAAFRVFTGNLVHKLLYASC